MFELRMFHARDGHAVLLGYPTSDPAGLDNSSTDEVDVVRPIQRESVPEVRIATKGCERPCPRTGRWSGRWPRRGISETARPNPPVRGREGHGMRRRRTDGFRRSCRESGYSSAPIRIVGFPGMSSCRLHLNPVASAGRRTNYVACASSISI